MIGKIKRQVLRGLSGAAHPVANPAVFNTFSMAVFPFSGNQERKLKKNVETCF
ncbi:hypothetical protein NEILACOT_04776 [Neisseria lactamica ATCC 23970]|uniref:Uncharacterized protein n=1 Tax=Neisseria lactamica ATCC 23970 TaxID=546265 RepID=D0WB52_NEILA|nr:hypothetical protein NEILACOT_04776 [Neisseria lactamica ATCC 23970]